MDYRFSLLCVSCPIGVWEYIEATRDLVRDLEQRVRLAKANVDSICTIMEGWCKTPLYKRKGDKKESLLHLEVINVTTNTALLHSLVSRHSVRAY